MIKKRLSLSLVALIGSVFLFVIASFAWFAVSDIVNIDGSIIDIQDIDVSAVLYESYDDVTYNVVSSIDFQTQVPGDIKYYKLLITNDNDFTISTQVSLFGVTDIYTDINGDTANYTAGRSLAEVLLLNASNNIDSVTIVNQSLTTLIASTKVITHESVSIPASGTAELYFSFTVSEDAGNDYQNLRLDFTNLFVQSSN